jgi:hypothetical protein
MSETALGPRVRIIQRAVTMADFSWISMTALEFQVYFGDRPMLGQIKPVLEVQGGSLNDIAACCAGLDLVLGRWRQLLHREQAKLMGIDESMKLFHKAVPRLHRLTDNRIGQLRRIVQYLSHSRKDLRQRRQTAFRRWHAAVTTHVGIDSIMHCLAALEGLLLMGTGDMRLRMAVRAAGAVPPRYRAVVFRCIYWAYGARNDYAHGKAIPELSAMQQWSIIEATTRVIRACLGPGMRSPEELDSLVIRWLAPAVTLS